MLSLTLRKAALPARRLRVDALGYFKQALTRVGARTSDRTLHHAQMVVNYMRLGRWMEDHGFAFPERLPGREEVFDRLIERVRDRKVLYLEFGVYRGASIRYWSERLRHPGARLHGFDSFEGLPEDFCVGGGLVRGRFSTGGRPPRLSDPRVRFFKGWFQDVLPAYRAPDHEVLVVNLDADLYSSTILVLRHLRPWLRPGSLLYFDDLSRPDHEPRALDEFLRETGLILRPICADRSLNRAAFECLGERRAPPAPPPRPGPRAGGS